MSIEFAEIVSISETVIWIESGMCGERAVVLQHEGCEPFEYAVFNYDYRYTSNSGTFEAARQLALSLGAKEPIEQRNRSVFIPTTDEILMQIDALKELLDAPTKS